MIEIANIKNSSYVEFRVKRKLTKAAIEKIDNYFENEIKNQESINLLLEMEDWEGITAKGLLEDFKLIKQVKKMDKVAIVADNKLLKADAKIEDLYPGVEIVYFEPHEKDAAKKWLET